jgi:hypothetical protein
MPRLKMRPPARRGGAYAPEGRRKRKKVGSWEGEKVGGLEEHRAKSRGQKTEYGMRKWAEDRILKSASGP